MLKVKAVSHAYAEQTVIHNANFQIAPGEMIFITGSSGAGKSTLLRLLSGAELPTEGDILIGGYNTKNLTGNERLALRREVATIFQDPLLLGHLSVRDNIALPLKILGYGKEHINQRVTSAMKRLDLIDQENALPVHLSVGQQQRVSIARALVNHPNIILADEPTGNLDYQVAHDIVMLLKRFQQRGTTVVIVTHDLKLISDFGNRTLIIDHGTLVADWASVQNVDQLYGYYYSQTGHSQINHSQASHSQRSHSQRKNNHPYKTLV